MSSFSRTADPELAHHIARPLVPVEEASLKAIERSADAVLADVGIRFNDPATVEMLVSIGGEARGDVVLLDGGRLREIIRRSAPRSFTVRARNERRDTPVGGTAAAVFAPIYGAPDVLLQDGRRVRGTRQIYGRLVAEAHGAVSITNSGQMICVMDDVPEARRPLEMLLAHLTHSDKPFMGSIASEADAREIIELTRQALGRPAQPGACNLLHLVNCTPPLTYWENPLKCLRAIAELGEASVVSSYMMMGATSPATAAGTLIQGYAEVLAGLALTQLWRPGAPVVMGILGWPFDMRRMVPSFGDPASQSIQYHAAALGRRLGVPVRADGAVTSSKIDDGQAGAEGGRVLSAAVASGADFVLHAAGWLEQGRCVSVEKLRRDSLMIPAMKDGGSREEAPPLPLDPEIAREIVGRAERAG